MSFSSPQRPAPLLDTPIELLLTVLDFLSEPNLLFTGDGEREHPSTSYFIRHIRSFSLVSQRLRRLCLPLLFASVKFTTAQQQQLRSLEAKCAEDVQFACLIRKLNLSAMRLPTFSSPSLLSRLPSLEWLDLDPCQVNADLLAKVNPHPNLKTVAICDTCLDGLARLASSTPLFLSKILIRSAVVEYFPTLQSPALHSVMNRSPRLANLALRGKNNLNAGAGALFIRGLETLDIGVYREPTSFMSWLPAFVERHTSLTTITFTGDQYGSRWSRNPDILFPLQFIDAVERESLNRTVALNTLSISRAGSPSLDTWRVTALQLELNEAAGLSALRILSSLAPQLSSLDIHMTPFGRRPIPDDDLVSALSCFSSLRRLYSTWIYQHLVFEEPAPWDLPSSDANVAQTSQCMAAHAALHWIMARVAQCTPTLEVVFITDVGADGKGRLRRPWTLEVTYQVRRNPEVEFHGTPQFVMAHRFSVPR